MKHKVYELVNPINDQVFYIGITVKQLDKRLKQHCSNYQWKVNVGKMKVIKSIKQSGLNPIINCLFDNLSIEEAEQLEIDMIDKMRILGYPLENIAKGGKGHCGVKTHSEETKLKMSLAKIGKKKSDKVKANMSKAQKGRIISDSHRKKISESNKGQSRPHTKESKEKLSKANTGKIRTEENIQKLKDAWVRRKARQNGSL